MKMKLKNEKKPEYQDAFNLREKRRERQSFYNSKMFYSLT